MMGKIFGKAAAISAIKNLAPLGVYEQHVVHLQDLMQQPGFLYVAKAIRGKKWPSG
jgi:hypothetical protein